MKQKWLIRGTVLVILIAFFAWIYGWGGSDINVIKYNAESVDHIKLSGQIRGSVYVTELSEKSDIQAVINAVNSFRFTGNELKYIPKFIMFSGGSALYQFQVYLLNGETFCVSFANNFSQDATDTEVSYWVDQAGKTSLFSNTCRGSMELFYKLLEKGEKIIR